MHWWIIVGVIHFIYFQPSVGSKMDKPYCWVKKMFIFDTTMSKTHHRSTTEWLGLSHFDPTLGLKITQCTNTTLAHNACSSTIRLLWIFDVIAILTNSDSANRGQSAKQQKLDWAVALRSLQQGASSKSHLRFELIAGVIELDSRSAFLTSSTATRNPRVCSAAWTLP